MRPPRPRFTKEPIPKDIKILFIDFDGTLKPAGGHVARPDISAMRKLGRLGLIRVVATGRGLFSFQRDYPEDFELDYLLFSSGLGLCAWHDGPGPLLLAQRFTDEDRDRALAACLELKRGFYAFEPPPECHRHIFQYPEGYPPTVGFLSRLRSYVQYSEAYRPKVDQGPRAEFLITAPTDEMPEVMARFEELCPGLSLLRCSSPFGDNSMWLEIFPPGVNKGQAAQRLAETLSLTSESALAIGNDFNDQALLAWAKIGMVTYNAPEELRNQFRLLPPVTKKPLNYAFKLINAARRY
ncbi:MAG: Cof-type HAD-IIB family hydrolase [Deltaproteobacteria bacterium]|jgi:hydroxymethylpyrimidine pyrophosphatase-like HAD family hydrolase|nr:Cof-type HAD-IIB family hydrolase [Deltaproteobacteria bacterium]